MPEAPKSPWLLIGISAGLIVLAIVIVVAAAVSPPSPERVTEDFLGALLRHDSDKLANLTVSTAQAQLAAAAGEGDAQPKWLNWWQRSTEFFQEFRITETRIEGDEARVSILYGPGLFLEMDVLLEKEGRHWKVRDAE